MVTPPNEFRLEHQRGVFDAVEWQFVAVVGEPDAEQQRGLLIGEQLFAVEVETCVQGELVAAGAEHDRRGEFACHDHASADGLVGRVGDGDDPARRRR